MRFTGSAAQLSLAPWPSAVAVPIPLCVVINSTGTGSRATLTALYRQNFLPLSGDFVSGNVVLQRAVGRMEVGGQQGTLLRCDALAARSDGLGILSLSNERIDFELSSAHSVRKHEGDACSNPLSGSEGKDVRRRWLETWPPWLQATLGVLISGLGLQVILPFIVPGRLKR